MDQSLCHWLSRSLTLLVFGFNISYSVLRKVCLYILIAMRERERNKTPVKVKIKSLKSLSGGLQPATSFYLDIFGCGPQQSFSICEASALATQQDRRTNVVIEVSKSTTRRNLKAHANEF